MTGLWRRPEHSSETFGGAPWGRRRILGLLLATGCFGLLMVLGLVLAVRFNVAQQDVTSRSQTPASARGSVPASTSTSGRGSGGMTAPQQPSQAERRDALADAPMLEVSAEDSRSGEPAISPAASISIPDATEVGAARVPSGYPHTTEGAVGQLAAIEVVVLQAMSVPRTVEVHTAWASPAAGAAGPAAPADRWPLADDVRSFLGAARMGPQKDSTTTVTVTPVAAQVKATDGPDWVIGCVLVDIRAVIATEERMAYGYCERMQWNARQWMIAPGTPPAAAPSTWPGTELAGLAGWRTWQTG